jgi:hypothetical protein
MPIEALPFNPSQFFAKTAQYASSGRGQFCLTKIPDILNPTSNKNLLSSMNADYIDKASTNLMQGWLAKSFTTPMVDLQVHPAFSYSGPTKAMPFGQSCVTFDVEFLIMGQDLAEARSLYYFFHRWQEGICGPRRSPNPQNNSFAEQDDELSQSDTIAFDVQYYDHYTADAELRIYSPNASDQKANPESVIAIKFTELYPKSITQLNVSWENGDSPLTFYVQFAFYYAKAIYAKAIQ